MIVHFPSRLEKLLTFFGSVFRVLYCQTFVIQYSNPFEQPGLDGYNFRSHSSFAANHYAHV